MEQRFVQSLKANSSIFSTESGSHFQIKKIEKMDILQEQNEKNKKIKQKKQTKQKNIKKDIKKDISEGFPLLEKGY